MASPLQQIDSNLQTIRALEGASTLPSLPSEVTLDLAGTTAMTPSGLKQLLLGLEQDIEVAQKEQPLPVRHPELWTPLESRYDRGPEVARLIYGVTGTGRVERYDPNAVVDWKRRAVDRGYLDLSEEQIQDERWLPEYSSVAAEMMRDQARREFSGDKPGSVSIDQVMGLVEDWLSPRGLYQAALELDLWWDFDSVGREMSSWGDKFREWAEEPWNPARAIDALTGPIDDLVFPVINWGLMFTGIGEAFLGVRAAYGATKGLSAAEHVLGLYRGAKGLKALPHLGKAGGRALIAADRAQDVENFRKMSFSAQLLGPRAGVGPTGPIAAGLDTLRGSTVGKAAFGSMQKWRDLSGVVAAKKVNQQVLRLGFMSNVESLIDDERGRSIATETRIDEAVAGAMANPLVDWSVDLLLYPPNLFERGAVTAGFRALGHGAAKTGGWHRLTQNEELTLSWHRAVRTNLAELEDGGRAVSVFDNDVKEVGVIQALANNLADGDVEQLGQTMGYVTLMGAVDAASRTGGYHLEQIGSVAEELMNSATRARFHRNRNHILAQLRHYDPDDVMDIIEGMSRHGLNPDVPVPGEVRVIGPKSQAQADIATARKRMRAAYLEPADVTAARGGAVADGDVRLYGFKDADDLEEIRWTTTMPDTDDPYFVDVNLAEFGLSEAEVAGRAQELGELLSTRYRLPGARQARLSQATEVGRFDQEKLRFLKDYARQHNDMRAGFIANLMSNVNQGMLQQYIYETLPRFGRWGDFTDAIHEARRAVRSGRLDNARLIAPVSEAGHRSALMPRLLDAQGHRDRWWRELDELVIRLGDDPQLRKQLQESIFSPLVREVDPSKARITVQAIDEPTKGEMLGFAQTLKAHQKKVRNFRKLQQLNPQLLSDLDEGLQGTQEALAVGGEAVSTKKRISAVVAEVAGEHGLSQRAQTELRMLVREAMSQGVTMEDLGRALDETTTRFLADDRWGRFSVPEQIGRGASTVDDVLKERLDELMRQSMFVAAEIDAPADLAEALAGRGYKLVYGANFAAPEDVMDLVPQFADLSHRRVRSGALRSWFGRKDPEYVRRYKTRILKSKLKARLHEARAAGKNISLDLDDEASVNKLLSDLYDQLHAVQNDARIALENSQEAGIVSRIATRASLARIPFDLSRLPSDVSGRKWRSMMKALGLSEDTAEAVRKALMESQALGFQEQGLFSIESFLRSRNNAAQGLRMFGKHRYSDNVFSNRTQSMLYNGLGIAGGSALAGTVGEDDSPMENIAQFATGFLATTGAIKGAHRRWGSAEYVGGMAGRIEGHKWGYLADNLANLRDMVRFSLSPIFDASRYSEAVILGQVGEVPTELRNLRVNQSPTGVRRALMREARELGDPDPASYASNLWNRNRDEFYAVAKGDLEMETIDSVARRFSSVGILGFSPTEWMESTYFHLRRAGVDPADAYKAVRDTYTYGVTGRSSAELSMNFVFFPFSFTKKVATHMGKFMAEDLGRLILIQDGLAAYQALNERYDLSEEFRDRLPIINRMNRLNVLAYGLSPGRFGGINAPIIEGMLETPGIGDAAQAAFANVGVDDIAGAFMPQMVQINNEQDANQIMDLLEQMMPVVNDIDSLISDFYQQSRVIASSSHLTTQAEQRRGWEAYREFQDELKPVLDANGLTWSQAMQRPAFAAYVRAKRADIAETNPSWVQAWGDGVARSEALDMELQNRLHHPKGEADRLLALYVQDFNAVSEALRAGGRSFRNPEEIPPQVYEAMRRRAVELAQEDQRFLRLYQRFYRRLFGDITVELI